MKDEAILEQLYWILTPTLSFWEVRNLEWILWWKVYGV